MYYNIKYISKDHSSLNIFQSPLIPGLDAYKDKF